MNDVCQARYVRDYVLHVEFDNGLAGDVDLAAYLNRGPVFEPLAEPSFFAQFTIEGGTVAWPNGADIAPEQLYEMVEAANKARQTEAGAASVPIPAPAARRGCA